MAFETVTGSVPGFNPKTMKVGESKDAYLKDVTMKPNKFGSTNFDLVCVDPGNGVEYPFYGAGNLKWIAKNIAAVKGMTERDPKQTANEERDAKLLGYLVRITYLGETEKNGKKTPKFTVARDPERALKDATLPTNDCAAVPF